MSKTWCFSRQRLGLHPGLQRQGGCGGLALGFKGKGINIIVLHTNMQTKADKEPLPQGLIREACHGSGFRRVSGGRSTGGGYGTYGQAGNPSADIVGK